MTDTIRVSHSTKCLHIFATFQLQSGFIIVCCTMTVYVFMGNFLMRSSCDRVYRSSDSLLRRQGALTPAGLQGTEVNRREHFFKNLHQGLWPPSGDSIRFSLNCSKASTRN